MANTTNFNWETPDDTDLVKDGAAAIRTLGSAIDTSLVDLKGGTTGQVLSKATNTDMDFTWVAQDDSNAIQNAIIDAKGDLIVGTAADTPARLAVGTNGYILTADSAEAAGMKWAAAAGGGGKVLQVVSSTYSTDTNIASTTLTDTGLSLSITPTLNTSKVLVLISQSYQITGDSEQTGAGMELRRGGTTVFDMDANGYNAVYTTHSTKNSPLSASQMGYISFSYLDSPATTSSTTYKTMGRVYSTALSRSVYFQREGCPSSIILMEIGA